jgi:hypothetical protein
MVSSHPDGAVQNSMTATATKMRDVCVSGYAIPPSRLTQRSKGSLRCAPCSPNRPRQISGQPDARFLGQFQYNLLHTWTEDVEERNQVVLKRIIMK